MPTELMGLLPGVNGSEKSKMAVYYKLVLSIAYIGLYRRDRKTIPTEITVFEVSGNSRKTF